MRRTSGRGIWGPNWGNGSLARIGDDNEDIPLFFLGMLTTPWSRTEASQL